MPHMPHVNRPEVRKLGDGGYCVDLGRRWFRVAPDGKVTAKETALLPGNEFASIVSRDATAAETKMVKDKITEAGL